MIFLQDKTIEDMANYSTLPGQRGNIYWFEGFVYYKDKTSRDGQKLYLKCKDKLPNNGGTCGGRAVLCLNSDTIQETKSHSHPSQTHQDEGILREFRASLQKAAEECSSGLLRESYDRVSANFPGAATLLPYTAIERSMAIWRRKRFPKNPDSAQTVCASFARFAGQVDHKFAMFYKSGKTSEHGTFLILLNTDDKVKAALTTTPSMQADGTFRSCPKAFYQAVHFFLEVQDTIFCFASVWLTGKSEALYKAAFQELRTLLPRDCNPSMLMTDYEIALQAALQDMFPGAELSACMFHFNQGVYRNLLKKGLCNTYKTNKKFKHWISLLFCLPLLPAARLQESWNFLKTERFSVPVVEKKMIARFKKYMERQWINGVAATCLSVFGCERRTNNDSEIFNRYLNRRAKVAHPNVYTFGEIVAEALQKASVELQSISHGIPVRRNQRNTIAEKNLQIRVLQDKLASGRMEPVVFLAKAAGLCRGYHTWMSANIARDTQNVGENNSTESSEGEEVLQNATEDAVEEDLQNATEDAVEEANLDDLQNATIEAIGNLSITPPHADLQYEVSF